MTTKHQTPRIGVPWDPALASRENSWRVWLGEGGKVWIASLSFPDADPSVTALSCLGSKAHMFLEIALEASPGYRLARLRSS
jgi:hypothetical protein